MRLSLALVSAEPFNAPSMTQIPHTPFTPWTERPTADVRRASQAQYMHGWLEILAAQGPMQALSMFQIYGKASGVQKLAAPVRKLCERALLAGVKSGEIILEREDDSEVETDEDSVCWIVRLPEQAPVILRDLGSRGFADIPMRELAALVLEVRTQDEFMGREDIYRAVLDHYGLQKLTALVRRRLDKVLTVYF